MKHPGGPPFGKSLTQRNLARQQQLTAAYGAALRKGQALIAGGRFAEAAGVLAPLLPTGRAEVRHLYYLARRGHAEQLLSGQRMSESVALLRRLLRERPSDARAWWLLGVAHFRLADHHAAAAALRRAASIVPNDAGLQTDLATALEAVGDIPGSRAAARRAARLRPDRDAVRRPK